MLMESREGAMCSPPFFPLIALRQGLPVNRKLLGRRLDWLAKEYQTPACLWPQVLGVLACTARASFYVGAGDSNLGPHACSARLPPVSVRLSPSCFAPSQSRCPSSTYQVTLLRRALT